MAGLGETVSESIESNISTGTSDIDGTRHSADSGPTTFNCPDGFIINRDSVVAHVLNEQGSEHTFNVTFDNFVDLIPGVPGVKQPTTITVTTHARSSKGSKGGKGAMGVRVDFNIVRFKL